MKERNLVLIGLIIFLLFFTGFLSAINSTITGKTITTKATQQVSVNITVTASNPPTLTLINPKNQTYVNNQSIPLAYTASNEDNVWYNLDSGANITLTHSIIFSASEGSHTLFLYADNENGETSKSVTFVVGSTIFNISNNEFKGEKKGDSTNLSDYSYEELQNLSNLILENIDFGEIRFNENVNLTDDENFDDGEISFDDYVNISTNRIEINSTALPNFNRSATLQLYGLTFSNPRILRGEAVCPSTICTFESYSGNILKFNVTSFSVYSSEETPVTPSETPSGGTTGGTTGGGSAGGAVVAKIKSFSIGTNEIGISLNPGSITTKSFIITNLLDKKIIISLSEWNLEGKIAINEPQIELEAGETKEVSFDIIIREDIIPNLYIGKIIIKNGITTEEIFLMIEVEYKDALFDLRVNIPDEYSNVLPGKEILAEIELFNLGLVKRADVEIEYTIEDDEGNKIITEKETIAVETKTSFIKRIKIPENYRSGKHILYIKAIYNEKFASATASFNVIKWGSEKLFIVILLSVIILLGFIVYFYVKRKKDKIPIRRLKIEDMVKRK